MSQWLGGFPEQLRNYIASLPHPLTVAGALRVFPDQNPNTIRSALRRLSDAGLIERNVHGIYEALQPEQERAVREREAQDRRPKTPAHRRTPVTNADILRTLVAIQETTKLILDELRGQSRPYQVPSREIHR